MRPDTRLRSDSSRCRTWSGSIWSFMRHKLPTRGCRSLGPARFEYLDLVAQHRLEPCEPGRRVVGFEHALGVEGPQGCERRDVVRRVPRLVGDLDAHIGDARLELRP